MGNVLLQSLGIVAFFALVGLAAWAAAVLSGRRRELLQELRAKRCPVCGRLGALRCDCREAVAGTARRGGAAGFTPQEPADRGPAGVSCYRYTWRCRYCGAEKVVEQQAPDEPAAAGAPASPGAIRL